MFLRFFTLDNGARIHLLRTNVYLMPNQKFYCSLGPSDLGTIGRCVQLNGSLHTTPSGIVASSLDADTWEKINDTALWIAKQKDVSALQSGALERIAGIVPHRSSMFDLAAVRQDGTIAYTHAVSTTMSADTLSSYYLHYAALDYTVWSFDPCQVEVYRDLDLVDVTRRDETPIYREWMLPQGVYYGCGATLALEGMPLGSITLFREQDAGDFTPAQMRVLLELARHLSARLGAMFPKGVADYEQESSLDEATCVARRFGLSGREKQVLSLMLDGMSNRRVAEKLYVSESTIKKHVNSIYKKVGVTSRIQLAAVVSGHKA